MKIDFHIHSKYSHDTLTSLHSLKKQFEKKGLKPIITDHGTIKGALEYKRLYGSCIIAEEIETNEGELIGIYLNEEIPEGLSIEATIDRIRSQDGIVYVPHPFDTVRSSTIKRHNFKADIFEVFNSRVLNDKHNQMAEQYAEEHGILKAVGSDAHFSWHVGLCYAEMEDFNNKKELLTNLKRAVLIKRKTPPIALGASAIVNIIRKPFLRA